MAEYAKPWLSVDEQIDRLAGHGVEIEDRGRAASVLQAVGYYRLTGYLYPFRESEPYVDDEGRGRIRVLSNYRAGTTLRHAEDVIDFDRRLRMLVMDGVERIEVAVRMRIGYVLGRRSPFAYEDPACFTTPSPPRAPTPGTPRRAGTCGGSSASTTGRPAPTSSSSSTSARSTTTGCRSGR